MAKSSNKTFKGKDLTRGELRKLKALRKSLGKHIADKAFTEWLAARRTGTSMKEDKNAELVVEVLQPLIKQGRLRIRRGGYLIRRGRGRVIVEPAEKMPLPPKPVRKKRTKKKSSAS